MLTITIRCVLAVVLLVSFSSCDSNIVCYQLKKNVDDQEFVQYLSTWADQTQAIINDQKNQKYMISDDEWSAIERTRSGEGDSGNERKVGPFFSNFPSDVFGHYTIKRVFDTDLFPFSNSGKWRATLIANSYLNEKSGWSRPDILSAEGVFFTNRREGVIVRFKGKGDTLIRRFGSDKIKGRLYVACSDRRD